MSKLLANVVAIISTCESKFALLGEPGKQSIMVPEDAQDTQTAENRSEKSSLGPTRLELELVKPKHEIEFGDIRLLRYLLDRVVKPYEDLMCSLKHSVARISICIAFVYVRLSNFTVVFAPY